MPPVRIRERAKAKKGTMKRLLKELFKRFPVQLIISALCIIFNIFANLCSSLFMGFVTSVLIDSIQKGESPFVGTHTATNMGITIQTNVKYLMIALGVIYGVGVFAAWFWNRTMAIVTQKFMNVFRKAMFNHMQDLPIKYFDTHAHGAIMSLYTNDIDTIRQFISQAMPTALSAGLAIVFSLTAMLLNSVWMTIVVVLCALAMLLNTMFIGKKASKYFIKQQIQVGKVEGNIEETIQGLKVVKVFSHEEKSAEDFAKLNNELREHATTANIAGNTMGPINMNIGNFMYVLTAIMGVLILVVPGFKNLTLVSFKEIDKKEFYSAIVSFLMLSRMFSNNVNNFSQQVTFIVMGMAGASRCFDLIDEQKEKDEGYVTLVHIKKHKDGTIEETDEKTRQFAWKHPHKADGTVTYTEVKGDIVLTEVDFAYEPEKPVLHDVSIYAHPGQQIAFVGATGAGKTTITNLLNRFYDIADGKIRYDGININKIKKADLRHSLGIVLQDTNLFTGTVMDNIRYGRLDATDEEVYEAAKIANAYDFITRLPEGFNTMLNGDGSNLSQGQRQLLSIARAAVADAPVMILDEATSSIDTRTEKLVQEGMDKLMKGRTVFVIAHRLSTVQNSDAIMVLDHGRIIERGNHASLIADKGIYYQLYTGAFELE